LALDKLAVKRATEKIDLSVGEDDIRQMKSRDKRYAVPWMTLRRDHDELYNYRSDILYCSFYPGTGDHGCGGHVWNSSMSGNLITRLCHEEVIKLNASEQDQDQNSEWRRRA